MKNLLVGIITKFILPLLVLYFAFRTNILLGFAAIIALAAYFFTKRKEGLYGTVGKYHYSKGNMENAIKWYEKAASVEFPSTNTLVSYGYLLLKTGETEKPAKMMDRLMNRSIPENEKMLAKSIKALVTWKKGNLDEAIEMLEDVITKFETSNIYGSLGYMYILKGDMDKALEFNLKAYGYNDDHDVILDNLGQTYYLMGYLEKAKDIYEKLINKKIKPTFPEVYYNYGLLLHKMDEKEDALENFNKALNYKTTFLSTISKEEIINRINEIKGEIA